MSGCDGESQQLVLGVRVGVSDPRYARASDAHARVVGQHREGRAGHVVLDVREFRIDQPGLLFPLDFAVSTIGVGRDEQRGEPSNGREPVAPRIPLSGRQQPKKPIDHCAQQYSVDQYEPTQIAVTFDRNGPAHLGTPWWMPCRNSHSCANGCEPAA